LYDAWGKVKKLPVDLVEQPIRLQGQYFDAETGLYYNRWRYYCPETGSFISQDPLGLAAGENVYVFGPNAQGWIDPLGLACKYAKTSFWERLTTNKLSTNKLVGNPADEFMNPKIGPSNTALSKHMKYIQQNGKIDEPILVKKLTNGTYEIQNGHHRWLAAQKMGLNKVPVKVMK